MGSASVDKDRMRGAGIVFASIGVYNFDLWQVCEIDTSAGGKIGIDFDSTHLPSRSNQLSQNRRIVPRAAAYMDDMLRFAQLERVDKESQKTWLAVVGLPRRINLYEHVVVHLPRIIIGRGPVVKGEGLPRPLAKIAFPRNGRKRPTHSWRVHLGSVADFFCIAAPDGLGANHWS